MECPEVNSSDIHSCSGNKGSRMETKVCVVGKQNIENEELMQNLKSLNLQIVTSETGRDVLQTITDNVEMAFLCDPFEGEDFENLHREEQRIIGPPVVHECAKDKLSLPYNSRPLFCKILENHVICFTAFRVKVHMARLADLIHHMGGSVRRDMTGRVTHLVANGNQGSKYKTAVSLGIPIMADEWIYKCWERRHDLNIERVRDDMRKYTQRIFCGSRLTFYGFSDEEKKHMEETTEQQGGEFVSYECRGQCTHVVVADKVEELPTELVVFIHMTAVVKKTDETAKPPKVVMQEWFWASIHMDACADESLYSFKDVAAVPAGNYFNQETPTKKRKCEDGTASNVCSLLSSPRRKKSIDALSPGYFSRLPITSPPLDSTHVSLNTPIQGDTPSGTMCLVATPTSSKDMPTARQQVAKELLETERNYVTILETILKSFKEPLEKDQRGISITPPIIPAENIKSIFGSLPDILQLHTKIKEELDEIVASWTEEKSIGNVILKHADELTRVYPRFINYFEMSKETIAKCDRDVARFHALLMANLSKPGCGRQTLPELLIRPVQRLPSVILLITDLIKRTRKSNPDHKALSQAVEVLKKTMMFINEDKRKTEGQVQMFEILRDVDGCPANILSSHRFYVTKVDTYEMSDIVVGRGEAVTIFLFSDSLEVTKRRGAKQLPMKSPAAKTPQKASYKHIELIDFNNIKNIVDVQDNDDFQNLFGMKYLYQKKEAKDKIEREAVFRLTGDDINKKDLIDKLLTGLRTVSCTVNKEHYLTIKKPSEMGLSKSNMSNGTLTRAVRVARRTTRKVSRALSMNKTPKKPGHLRRAASTIVVPGDMTSPLGPTTRHNHEGARGARPRANSSVPMSTP